MFKFQNIPLPKCFFLNFRQYLERTHFFTNICDRSKYFVNLNLKVYIVINILYKRKFLNSVSCLIL